MIVLAEVCASHSPDPRRRRRGVRANPHRQPNSRQLVASFDADFASSGARPRRAWHAGDAIDRYCQVVLCADEQRRCEGMLRGLRRPAGARQQPDSAVSPPSGDTYVAKQALMAWQSAGCLERSVMGQVSPDQATYAPLACSARSADSSSSTAWAPSRASSCATSDSASAVAASSEGKNDGLSCEKIST